MTEIDQIYYQKIYDLVSAQNALLEKQNQLLSHIGLVAARIAGMILFWIIVQIIAAIVRWLL